MEHTETPPPLIDTRVIDCGDNLEQLKKLPDKCIDLVYIDPSSDSTGTFKAFLNEWKKKLAFEDGSESTQPDLDFMSLRCVELARVLKPTGSFYFHCDWDAKDHVKEMLDQVLGQSNFIDEFRWKRQANHDNAAHGSNRLGRVHDTLLLYGGDLKCYFEHLYHPYDKDYIEKLYMNVEPETGRRYRLDDLVARSGTAPSNCKAQYEFLGVTGYWRYSKNDMRKLYEEGRIDQIKLGAEPHIKRYLSEIAGVPVGSVWDDIQPLQSYGEEHLGYPPQEPLKLLERLLELSSQPNDDLDVGCGRGTALVAALDSGRQWIGVGHFTDVLPLQASVSNGQDCVQVLPKIA
jgi:DNA modification methylase